MSEHSIGHPRFFDANCQVGRHNQRIEGTPYALGDLIADMREQAIAARLVHHAMAKENDTAAGNSRLMREITGQEGLYPCWGLGTWVTGEMSRPADLLRQLRESNVRAVRFFRYSYAIPPDEWSMGELWTALEEHCVPLVLDLGQRWATMDELGAREVWELCHAHPNLPVILTKHRIRFNRQVYQLFEACPNLRLELSGYWHYRMVEDICLRFGRQRLLFGTNWPYMDSSFAIAAVMYAEVSDEDRVAVAGGNLRSLLEAVQW